MSIYANVLSQRSDVGRKLGNDYNAVMNWWNQHGQNELKNRLKKLGRTDVVNAVDTGKTNLRDWYNNWGTKEYENIWTSNNRAVNGIAKPAARKAFSEVLPYEQAFNKNLMTSLAESQINPEIARASRASRLDLDRGLASSGAYRTGRADVSRKNLADQYERQRKEQVAGFTGNLQDWTTDWYNKQYETYNKNPSAFVMPELPGYSEFAQANPGLASTYQAATNPETQFKNPFLY